MRAVPEVPPSPQAILEQRRGHPPDGPAPLHGPCCTHAQRCLSAQCCPAATSPLDGSSPRETRHPAAPLLSLCACALVHATRRPLRSSLARKVVPCRPRDVAARDLPRPPPSICTPPRAPAASPAHRRAGTCSSPRPGPLRRAASLEGGRARQRTVSPPLLTRRPPPQPGAPTPARAARMRGPVTLHAAARGGILRRARASGRPSGFLPRPGRGAPHASGCT